MAGYARTNTADIQSGQVVKSAPINAELNAIVTAFAFSGGHNHDGSSTEGAYVGLIADTDALNKVVVDTSNNRVGFFSEVSSAAVEQIRIQDGAILPVTDNDIDLGASGTEFKDLFIDGTAHIDTLDVDDNATVAGTLGVTGAVTANAGVVVDNITIDGTEIDLSSGDLTIDVAGDIILNTDDGIVSLQDASATFGSLENSSGNLVIKSGTTTALTFSGANITAAGEVSMTTLDIGGTNVTSTAAELNILDGVTATTAELNIMDGVTSTTAELNIMDGVTSTTAELNIVDGDTSATSTTVADADRVVLNDNGTMVQVAVTDLAAYFDDEITAMPNLVTTSTLDSGAISSGFGNIDVGSSNLTATGTVSLGATSFNDNAITNVGNIALDSISADDTDINVAVTDNSATAFTIKQGSDAYLIVDTANSSESVSIGTGISGTAITIGHGTSEVTIGDNLTVAGNLTVSGTQTVVDTVTMNAQNAVVFEGATADDHETTLTITDPTADRTIKLPNQSGTLPVLAADSDTAITSTPAELNILDGVTATTAELNIMDGVTATTAELNIMDGVTATTSELNIMDGVTATAAELNIMDGVTTTAAEINLIDGDTARGTTAVASGDGILINDAGTMRMTNVDTVSTYFASHNVGGSNIVTTGALNSGSITSGFGSINNGSSAITTTGTVTYGSLSDGTITITAFVDEDGMDSNSATLVPTQQSVKAYVDDNRNVTGLNATGAELNTVADNSAISIDTSTAIANNDGMLMFDTSATAAKYFDVDLVDTYFAGTTKTLTNKTLTAPKFADGGFIADANGNELIMLQTASSAVNQLEVTNSASGGSVVVGASGDDSNIDIDISPKGTGEVNIAAGNLNYGGTAVTATGAELNLTDGSSSGTIVNSKAVIYGGSGEVNATTLQIAGTSITSTAAELNIMDGDTSASSTTLADADRLVTNDAGTMKQVALTDVKTYLSSAGFTTDDPTALAIALG